MSDLCAVDVEAVVVVPVLFFPTARSAAVSSETPEFTDDGRSRAIEFALAKRGPRHVLANASRYDVRAEAGPGVEWPGIDLWDEDVSGLLFNRANLTGARLGLASGADFQHARLDRVEIEEAPGAEFDFADMHEARCGGARLERASFTGASLGGADFSEASLRRARFTGADLSGATFVGADLHNTDIHFVAAAAGADFSEALGLTLEQRQALAALGAVGLGDVWLAPLLDLEFSA
jgi:uncharacterized protein YjbI with pentapeptide repeats